MDLMSMVGSAQIYKIGEHRLMHGDALNPQSLISLLGDDNVNMVFTDPPYDFKQFNWFDLLKRYMTNSCEIFVMNNDKYLVELAAANLDIFRFFFSANFSKVQFGGSSIPPRNNDLIAYFRRGKTKYHKIEKGIMTSFNAVKKEGKTHRHEKDVEMVKKFIEQYTNKGDIVLDVFGGSGTTMLACQETGRQCYMMDIDLSNIIKIQERMRNQYGLKAR